MIHKSLQLQRLSVDSGCQGPDAGIQSFDIQKAGGRMIESKDDNSEARL